MDVIELLSHCLRTADQLGMGAFLSELIGTVSLARAFCEMQTLQHSLRPVLLQVVDDPSRREGLEAAHALAPPIPNSPPNP